MCISTKFTITYDAPNDPTWAASTCLEHIWGVPANCNKCHANTSPGGGVQLYTKTYVSPDFCPVCEGFARIIVHRLINETMHRSGTLIVGEGAFWRQGVELGQANFYINDLDRRMAKGDITGDYGSFDPRWVVVNKLDENLQAAAAAQSRLAYLNSVNGTRLSVPWQHQRNQYRCATCGWTQTHDFWWPLQQQQYHVVYDDGGAGEECGALVEE